MIWSNAMQQIRDAFDQNQISKLYFHPLQEFDCRCQHLALNCNVMVFLLHMDGIVMGHLLTLDTEHITVGFVVKSKQKCKKIKILFPNINYSKNKGMDNSTYYDACSKGN